MPRTWPRPMRASVSTATSTAANSSRRPAPPAPTPFTRVTDSSPRTPVSRRRSPMPDSIWIGPPPAAVTAMGSKIEAKKMMAAAGVPVLAELDPETVRPDELPVLVEGLGRWRRPGYAGGRLPGRPAGTRARGPARGGGGVRRRLGVLRALPAPRPPRRSPGDGRRARHRVGSRRTGVLHPATPPEDHRGGALTARRTHPRHAGATLHRRPPGRQGHRLLRRRHGGVPGRRRRRVLLPGDEHPPSGRAPGHRTDHPIGSGRTAACGRGR